MGALSSSSDVGVSELIKSIKERDLGAARKWVVNNIDNDVASKRR